MNIEKYLTQGEVVDKTFTSKGYDIHATNKRLFISSTNGKYVADFDYNHISSLVFNKKTYHWLAVLGGIILAASIYFYADRPIFINQPFVWIGIAIGIILVAAGIIGRREYMRIFVIGVSDRLEIPGKRSNLDGLFTTIRQKKEERKA